MAKKSLPSVFANGGPTHAANGLLWRLQVSKSPQETIEAVGAWAVTEFGMTKVEREQFLLALGLREKFTPQGQQVYTLFTVDITNALEHVVSRATVGDKQ